MWDGDCGGELGLSARFDDEEAVDDADEIDDELQIFETSGSVAKLD
jgi:hypothetical protein